MYIYFRSAEVKQMRGAFTLLSFPTKYYFEENKQKHDILIITITNDAFKITFTN